MSILYGQSALCNQRRHSNRQCFVAVTIWNLFNHNYSDTHYEKGPAGIDSDLWRRFQAFETYEREKKVAELTNPSRKRFTRKPL